MFGLRYGFYPRVTNVISRTIEVLVNDIISVKSGKTISQKQP